MSHGHDPSPSPVKMGLPIPDSKLGMWLFLGTEIMFFSAFIGTYIVLRIGSPGWPTDPEVTHIHILAGGINTFVLILSSYFVVVAHEAMSQKNFAKARQFLWMTFSLAVLFLGIKSYEYYGKFTHDILPGHIPETSGQAMNKAVGEIDKVVAERYAELLPRHKETVDRRGSLQAAIDALVEVEEKDGEKTETAGEVAELFGAIEELSGSQKAAIVKALQKLEDAEASGKKTAEPTEYDEDKFGISQAEFDSIVSTAKRTERKMLLGLLEEDFTVEDQVENLRVLQKFDAEFQSLQRHVQDRSWTARLSNSARPWKRPGSRTRRRGAKSWWSIAPTGSATVTRSSSSSPPTRSRSPIFWTTRRRSAGSYSSSRWRGPRATGARSRRPARSDSCETWP